MSSNQTSKKKPTVKLNITGMTAKVDLPGGYYWATIKALKFALKNKFSRDEDYIWFVEETLKLLEDAIKSAEKTNTLS